MKTEPQRILILGAGYAGLCAASRLRRQLGKSSNCRITVIGQEKTFTQRIRLHQRSAGQAVAGFDLETELGRQGIAFQPGTVDQIDLAARCVRLTASDGSSRLLPYDYLVYALGSRARPSLWPEQRGRRWRFDTPAGADQVYRQLDALGKGRLGIAGGGLTAIEAAAELAERFPHLAISLFTRHALLADYSAKARRHVLQFLAGMGVAVHEQEPVCGFSADGCILTRNGAVPFDLCLDLTGFAPPNLARDCGLPVTPSGQVRVNACLQAEGYPHIFVAGDAAAVYFADHRPVRMSCQAAMPMGAQAGQNLGRLLQGAALAPFRYAVWWRCISLGRQDGVVQLTTRDDRPAGPALTGRFAARFKEWICRLAYWTLLLELRFGLPLVWWPKAALQFAAVGSLTEQEAAL